METASLEDIFTHEARGFSGSKQTTYIITTGSHSVKAKISGNLLSIWEGKKDLTLE